ncbi:MAG: thioredoxin-dependent thiol peroxidase [Rhodobacteraceae bacterium]|nr:thioredoxin-dependent thiol peroxidase [Paracoccaceae bacterium]
MIETGDNAPEFILPRDGGSEVSLSAFRGKPLVVYFYPKDDTSGCTREALEFTARLAEFEALGATVIGVSKDTVSKHDKFRDKHDLGVILASDADSDVCERYGVWKEKSMYGKKFMGIERSTFLIDAEGKIAATWRKVKVPGHVDAVLDAVQSL